MAAYFYPRRRQYGAAWRTQGTAIPWWGRPARLSGGVRPMEDGQGVSMTDLPLAELARELYQRLSARDLAGYLELLADDAIFHVGGNSSIAGEYRGKAAIAALGMKLLEETGGSFRTELISVLANGSHAMTLHRWSAERRGRRIEMCNFNVYRFANGLVAERWEFIEDQEAHDAFWAL
jgi:ketosteroid isomerase-like protein